MYTMREELIMDINKELTDTINRLPDDSVELLVDQKIIPGYLNDVIHDLISALEGDKD